MKKQTFVPASTCIFTIEKLPNGYEGTNQEQWLDEFSQGFACEVNISVMQKLNHKSHMMQWIIYQVQTKKWSD